MWGTTFFCQGCGEASKQEIKGPCPFFPALCFTYMSAPIPEGACPFSLVAEVAGDTVFCDRSALSHDPSSLVELSPSVIISVSGGDWRTGVGGSVGVFDISAGSFERFACPALERGPTCVVGLSERAFAWGDYSSGVFVCDLEARSAARLVPEVGEGDHDIEVTSIRWHATSEVLLTGDMCSGTFLWDLKTHTGIRLGDDASDAPQPPWSKRSSGRLRGLVAKGGPLRCIVDESVADDVEWDGAHNYMFTTKADWAAMGDAVKHNRLPCSSAPLAGAGVRDLRGGTRFAVMHADGALRIWEKTRGAPGAGEDVNAGEGSSAAPPAAVAAGGDAGGGNASAAPAGGALMDDAAGAAPPAKKRTRVVSTLTTPADGGDGATRSEVGLTCNAAAAGGEDGSTLSILSTLRSGHDRIDEPFEHALLRFFTTYEARELRLVCSEFVDAVSVAPWSGEGALTPIRGRLEDWAASFPAALDAHASFRDDLTAAGLAALGGATAVTYLNLTKARGLTDAALERLSRVRELVVDECGEALTAAGLGALPALRLLSMRSCKNAVLGALTHSAPRHLFLVACDAVAALPPPSQYTRNESALAFKERGGDIAERLTAAIGRDRELCEGASAALAALHRHGLPPNESMGPGVVSALRAITHPVEYAFVEGVLQGRWLDELQEVVRLARGI